MENMEGDGIMGRKKNGMCPYLEPTHSKAVLYYVCQAVGGKGLKIRPKDISSYLCFTSRYKNCENYKKCKKK